MADQADSKTIIVSGSKEAVEALKTAVQSTGSDCQISDKKNLPGGPEPWLGVANLVITGIPVVVAAIKSFTGRDKEKRIVKIRIGDLEIENPTEEDIARVLEQKK